MLLLNWNKMLAKAITLKVCTWLRGFPDKRIFHTDLFQIPCLHLPLALLLQALFFFPPSDLPLVPKCCKFCT